MPFDRNSRIRDVWQHPVGHDMLQTFMEKTGRSESWISNLILPNLRVAALDRVAGPDFVDLLLDVTAREPDRGSTAAAQQQAWWKERVQYQIFLPSFMDSDHDGIGDIAGVTQRLPYLEQLGVGGIWLWPLLETSGDGGVMDFKRVSPEYGDVEDLRGLIEAAHTRDIKVMVGLDITATAEQHPWFLKALAGGDTAGYYVIRKGTPDRPPNNWTRSNTATWKWVPELGAWCLRLCGRSKLDLNWDNPRVREYLAGVLGFWLEAGVDGFCFGSVNMIGKNSYEDGSLAADNLVGMCGFEKYGFGPRMHGYLKELRERAALDDKVLVTGEVKGLGTGMAKRFTDPAHRELDMIIDASHLVSVPRGKGEERRFSLQDLRRYYITWMEQYGNDRWMSIFFENTATPRMVSRVGASPVYRCILAKLLGTMMMTLRGTPIIYQGEELGLSNTRFDSPDELRDAGTLRRFSQLREKYSEAVALQQVLPLAAEHARTPIPWSTGPRAGFTGAEPWIRMPDGADFLNAATQMKDPSSVWRFYQRLIALRNVNPCLVYGSINIVFKNNKRVFCYFRILGNDKWYVEMNLTEKETPRPGGISKSQKLMLSNYDAPARTLRPYEANIYECE